MKNENERLEELAEQYASKYVERFRKVARQTWMDGVRDASGHLRLTVYAEHIQNRAGEYDTKHRYLIEERETGTIVTSLGGFDTEEKARNAGSKALGILESQYNGGARKNA